MPQKKFLLKGLVVFVIVALISSMNAPTGSAINGQAIIDPIESNIAVKFWVTSSSSSASSSSSYAHDDRLDTQWIVDESTPGHWLALDLSGVYDNLHKSEVIFSDRNAVYQYIIEASTDGTHWDEIVNRADNKIPAEGFVDLFSRTGIRYLRLKIIGVSPGAIIGIKEWRVFNYLRENIINGADMSYMDQLGSRNYYLNPNSKLIDMGPGPNVLDVVKDRGMKFIRLRIWNEPRAESSGTLSNPPYNNPDRSAVIATQIKDRSLQLGIDFHYADSWADPQKQPKPQRWADLGFDDLAKTLQEYTYSYIKRLVDQGTTPDKVAIGNEVVNGFLWGSESGEMGVTDPPYVVNNKALYWSQPGGGLLWKYWNSSDPVERKKYDEAWDRFTTLIAAGIQAVRQASPDTLVEIHMVNDKGKLPKTVEFWGQLLTRVNAKGADPDVLAISYYPEWHGTYQDLEEALHFMASTYPEYKIAIVETAYPATGGSMPLPNADQPQTIQGQANMLKRTIQAANDIINNAGTGVLVWEPQSYRPMFAPVKDMANYFEPYASIDVYNKAFAQHILEHNVYLTSRTPAPVLPATVQMLTLSDGAIRFVPVAWDSLEISQRISPGVYRVSGMTAYGKVTARVTVIYHFPRFTSPSKTFPR